ncbi:MAG TPA: hypothetical protein VFI90_09865 [Rubrobacter sp.]|nr:hypothetical protein [Rubrobacter sp.]
MAETPSRDDENSAEVGHVELERFTSPIVGIAGYYPLGSHLFPTGGFHQTIVGTEDGRLTELFWRPGETVNQEVLFDFSRISVPSKISAVAAYYSDNDGFHHQDVATEDGRLHELFWRPGPGVGHNVLHKFDSSISGVAAYFVPEDGFHHQDVATEDGELHELFWRPGLRVNEGVLETFTPPIVGVAAFCTPDGFQHQIVATEDRKVHQLWWRPGPEVNHRVLQEFTSDISGVAGNYTPDGFRRAIVATGDGKLTELSWKPGEAIGRAEIPHELDTRVVAIAGYFSYGDNRQHVILATDDNTVHDFRFGIQDDLGYPGDTASKPEIAKWMARCAVREGLPRELPVMCSLVEVGAGSGFGWNQGIRNVRDARGFSSAVDFDSLGFFQQRPASGWGCRRENNRCTSQQRAENIVYAPHAITEFLDEAKRIKFRDGFTNENVSRFGAWIQAVQISAFPGRYQLELGQARNLINS